MAGKRDTRKCGTVTIPTYEHICPLRQGKKHGKYSRRRPVDKKKGMRRAKAQRAFFLRMGNRSLGRVKIDHIRKSVPPAQKDIVMHYEMVKLDGMVKSGELVAAAEAVCGTLR